MIAAFIARPLTRRRPSTLLLECKGVQSVAELEIFGTQGSNFRCVLADTCILRFASSWRDTDISRSLIRTRKCAHWDNKANPPHLPMMPSAAQRFRLEVASSQVFSSEIHPTSVEWDTSVP